MQATEMFERTKEALKRKEDAPCTEKEKNSIEFVIDKMINRADSGGDCVILDTFLSEKLTLTYKVRHELKKLGYKVEKNSDQVGTYFISWNQESILDGVTL